MTRRGRLERGTRTWRSHSLAADLDRACAISPARVLQHYNNSRDCELEAA
jgi:hypothetical protein